MNFPDRFVFSGGGMKGIITIGFLASIQATNPECFSSSERCVRSFAGSSVGALIACLCYLKADFNSLLLLQQIERIVNACTAAEHTNTTGFSTGLIVKKMMFETIFMLTDLKNPTLLEAASVVETEAELVICATNTDTMTSTYFSAATHPQVKLIDVLFASMCVPILFQAIEIDNAYYVDGAITDNLPFGFDWAERYAANSERLDCWLFTYKKHKKDKQKPSIFSMLKCLLAGSVQCTNMMLKTANICFPHVYNLRSIALTSNIPSYAFSSIYINALLNSGEAQGKKFISLQKTKAWT